MENGHRRVPEEVLVARKRLSTKFLEIVLIPAIESNPDLTYEEVDTLYKNYKSSLEPTELGRDFQPIHVLIVIWTEMNKMDEQYFNNPNRIFDTFSQAENASRIMEDYASRRTDEDYPDND